MPKIIHLYLVFFGQDQSIPKPCNLIQKSKSLVLRVGRAGGLSSAHSHTATRCAWQGRGPLTSCATWKVDETQSVQRHGHCSSRVQKLSHHDRGLALAQREARWQYVLRQWFRSQWFGFQNYRRTSNYWIALGSRWSACDLNKRLKEQLSSCR